MLCLALADMSHLPEGNSSWLLIESFIAFCRREICMSLLPSSPAICSLSCWYSCSSSVFFCCDSSYFCFETQPGSTKSSPAPITHVIVNLFMGALLCEHGRWEESIDGVRADGR